MKTIINNSLNPYYNLALEEYVMKNVDIDEDIIILWQNSPTIVVGRNQNTIGEINNEYIKNKNINIVRRTSGGGAVYHDLGNLNYTFVTKNISENLNNYEKLTKPIIDAINSFGVDAYFFGRNDILLDNMKISGNAQSFYQNKMFQHGTILFNSDLNEIKKLLIPKNKVNDSSIKSNRSAITNIYPYLPDKISIDEFKDRLLKFILKSNDISKFIIELNDEDYYLINKLKKEKYESWEWNFGKNPKYSFSKEKRFIGGNIIFNMEIKNEIIKQIEIFGDFLGKKNASDLEKVLRGKKFIRDEIYNLLKKEDVDGYFYNITVENIIDCLFN
ncbi:MAG: lipoate--protein ligase [Bacilli bacterium]|nr:lipoate--protein ligase [Bacilli bacterium]